MIRNDLMFYESTAVLCFGYNPMAREYLYLKPLRNSQTHSLFTYIQEIENKLFSQIFKPINTWLCSMKKCMQMFKQWYLQMMDGGCTKYYRITGNY